MNKRERNFLISLMALTSLALLWGVRGGVITIEQAGVTVHTIVMACLAWLLLESVQ